MNYSIYFNVKPWYKSRTIWLAILQAIAGAYFAFFQKNPDIQIVGGPLMFKSALDIILRLVTQQPIS